MRRVEPDGAAVVNGRYCIACAFVASIFACSCAPASGSKEVFAASEPSVGSWVYQKYKEDVDVLVRQRGLTPDQYWIEFSTGDWNGGFCWIVVEKGKIHAVTGTIESDWKLKHVVFHEPCGDSRTVGEVIGVIALANQLSTVLPDRGSTDHFGLYVFDGRKARTWDTSIWRADLTLIAADKMPVNPSPTIYDEGMPQEDIDKWKPLAKWIQAARAVYSKVCPKNESE